MDDLPAHTIAGGRAAIEAVDVPVLYLRPPSIRPSMSLPSSRPYFAKPPPHDVSARDSLGRPTVLIGALQERYLASAKGG
jgi:hypothetical protein